jgi:hypothetical protein
LLYLSGKFIRMQGTRCTFFGYRKKDVHTLWLLMLGIIACIAENTWKREWITHKIDIIMIHLCSYKRNRHKGISPFIQIYINEFKVPYFSLPPRHIWVLRSSETLSGAGWYLVTHYQPTPHKFPEDRNSQ